MSDKNLQFLSLAGLEALWTKIGNKFVAKADLVEATTDKAGLMSASDKSKLDGVATGAQVNTIEGVAIAAVGATTATPTAMTEKTAILRAATTSDHIAESTEENPLTLASAVAVKDYVDTTVSTAVGNKNVAAEGDDYVTATAADNKVTVAASESTKASLALADTALQAADITTGAADGTIAVKGTDVAVKGLGSAAYTDATAYDAAGSAAAAGVTALAEAQSYTDQQLTNRGLTQTLGSAAFTDSTAYDAAGSAAAAGATALAEAKTYTDNAVDEITGASGSLTAHVADSVAHVTAEERAAWNAAKTSIDTFLAEATVTGDVVDTLKELQDYIDTHGEAAAALVDRVAANENAIKGLTGESGTIATAIEVAKSEAIAAAAEDATTKADAAKADAIAAGATYTDQKVQALAEGAVKDNTDAIAVLNGTGEGSVSKAVADAKAEAETYTDNAIEALKALGATGTEGTTFTQIVTSVNMVDGVLTYTTVPFAAIPVSAIEALV